MIKKQLIRARKLSRKDDLEREKTGTYEQKLRCILLTTQVFKILETSCKNSICY